ncbi:MAG TPA: acylphosphatase [Candidatus Deferrimicrobium sp.]|nr:acylphosphatase [Candidatus Deferrimicrobium sp.]
MSAAGVQLTIRGMVQGVGYRYWCYRQATELGVTGWVKNNRDGTVAVMAEGDRGLLEELIGQLKVGPSHAQVTDIVVTWTAFTGRYTRFDVSF